MDADKLGLFASLENRTRCAVRLVADDQIELAERTRFLRLVDG